MKFTHLHVHSHYSLLDGLAKIDELIKRAQELGMEALALTDHGSMYGIIEFYQKARKAGIKPIIGSEFYLAPNGMSSRRPNIDDKRNHLVLLAKDRQGYQNLIKLTTLSHLEGFYYKPRIDKKLLKNHTQGLIALSACLKGDIPEALINRDFDKAKRLAQEYQEMFGKDNFYLEIAHYPNLPNQAVVNKGMLEISKTLHIPLVATNDVHYLRPEDGEAQDILLCIQTNKKVADQDRLSMLGEDFSLRSPQQMIESFRDVPEAIENTEKIQGECNLEIELGKIQLPHFQVPDGYTPDSYLRELCYQGLTRRYGLSPSPIPPPQTRLQYELSIIEQTGFAPYFLIVQDFVNWAKNKGIVVGPGRGSAAGSLISYLLNITDVDPLKYNLLFERFLNPGRAKVSMPDIDLDFADNRRDEVIDYVASKYGKNRTAQIITFGTMAARAAIRDTGRALGYTYNLCDQIAKMIPMTFSLKESLERVGELKQMYDTDGEARKLVDTAQKLEGVARHASTHACGIVITNDDLDNIVPCQHASQDDKTIVTQYEMHAIADLGLLKIDLLGLKNLTIIENTLNIVEKTKGEKIDLDKIPPADEETLRLFREAKTTGVFQMESNGMKRYLKQLQPSKFDDIIAMVALYRPGPMELIPDFIARKQGYKKIEYLHPKLEPILKKTYGIAVYQEQVMQIAQELAGFTLSEADTLRKAVGKKIRKLLDQQKGKFIQGLLANEIDEITAERIWRFIEPFARYGFNAAHATCYALIGYQTAYLKAHYPPQFMAALMTSEQGDTERIATLVNECREMGIEILPPDINESFDNFTVIFPSTSSKSYKIRFGLAAIKNVGHNVIESIINERKRNGPFKTIEEFVERVQGTDKGGVSIINKKSLESLIKCGALDKLGERNFLLQNLEQILNYAREINKIRSLGQTSLFASHPTLVSSSLRLQPQKPAAKKEKLAWEKELLGLYVSEHPLKSLQEYLSRETIPLKEISSYHSGARLRIGGVISKIQKIITRTGKPMLFVQVEDLSSRIETIVFPNTLERNPVVWQEDKIVLINGRLNERDGSVKLICDEARELSLPPS